MCLIHLNPYKSHRDGQILVKQVVRSTHAELKEAQVTTVLTMENLMPALAHRLQPQVYELMRD